MLRYNKKENKIIYLLAGSSLVFLYILKAICSKDHLAQSNSFSSRMPAQSSQVMAPEKIVDNVSDVFIITHLEGSFIKYTDRKNALPIANNVTEYFRSKGWPVIIFTQNQNSIKEQLETNFVPKIYSDTIFLSSELDAERSSSKGLLRRPEYRTPYQLRSNSKTPSFVIPSSWGDHRMKLTASRYYFVGGNLGACLCNTVKSMIEYNDSHTLEFHFLLDAIYDNNISLGDKTKDEVSLRLDGKTLDKAVESLSDDVFFRYVKGLTSCEADPPFPAEHLVYRNGRYIGKYGEGIKKIKMIYETSKQLNQKNSTQPLQQSASSIIE